MGGRAFGILSSVVSKKKLAQGCGSESGAVGQWGGG
jgi:hypothetical protein